MKERRKPGAFFVHMYHIIINYTFEYVNGGK